MPSIVLCLHAHLPLRLKKYGFFDIGHSQDYFDGEESRQDLERVAKDCYLPTNRTLLKLIRRHRGGFRVSCSVSGMLLEQLEKGQNAVLESFRRLADTGCAEFVSGPWHHSLASLFSETEFREQVALHRRRVRSLFGQRPQAFRNTELIYGNDVARIAESMGFRVILAGGLDPDNVAGVIARVRVTQTFRNAGRKPIEAIYVFPASTRAAVHGMRVRIGERTIEARIERKAAARAQYEQARQEGKRAALLEQERPNVFTMSVANVMPGDRLVAELDYSELIVPEGGVYELVYPTVVGPRYGGGADPKADGWIANPTLTEGQPAPYRFGFKAHLESAIPVKDLSSPSHPLDVSWGSPRSVNVAVKGEDGGNRDVVLRWRLAGDAVEAGALLFPDDEGGGWFLATLEPPARVKPELIPPREYVFVLDVSGSMHGFPLDTAKAVK